MPSNMGLPQTFDPSAISWQSGNALGAGPKYGNVAGGQLSWGNGLMTQDQWTPGSPVSISMNAGDPKLTQGYGNYTFDPKSGKYQLSNFVAPQASDAGSLLDHLIQAGSMTGLAAAGGLAAGSAAGLTGNATSLVGGSDSLFGGAAADATAPEIAGFSPSAIAPSAPLDTSGMESLGGSGGGDLLGAGGGSSLGGAGIGGGGGVSTNAAGGMTFDNSGIVNDIANGASQSSAPALSSDASNIAAQGAAGIANDASPSFLSKLGNILQQKLPGQIMQFGNQQQTSGNNRLAALLMQRPEMAQGNLPGGGVTSPYGVV